MMLILLLISLLTLPINSQNLKLIKHFGSFENAIDFSYSSGGYFYVISQGDESLRKLDTNGTELANIGGYGWEQTSFDNPVDVFATPLKVYVADKNNNRILVFDRFLNYQFQITDDNITFFPQSCAVSEQGDIFILDSDNLRILKFDMFGNYVDEIGTITSGKFTFESPRKLAISQSGDLFVLDKNRVLIFDLFGNGKQIYSLPFEGENINSYGKIFTVNGMFEIIAINLTNGKTNLLNKVSGFIKSEFIKDSIIISNYLYVLTDSEIWVFKIS